MTVSRVYPDGTLGAALLAHDNEYRVDADVLARGVGATSCCTVVVPYYEASRTAAACVDHLVEAIAILGAAEPNAVVQIIVVDDGSIVVPAAGLLADQVLAGTVEVVTTRHNGGRASARNVGLQAADHPVVIFVDADVLVHPQTLVDHLRVHASLAPRRPITAGLFGFCDDSGWPALATDPHRFRVELNDFRLECRYRSSYIGCDDDRAFVGRRFRPLAQTNHLRRWPPGGFLGPWTIANMVLGGLFTCAGDLARSCGGFEGLIGSYGFVETTLVTKLIAMWGCPVVPVTASFSLHVDDRTVAIPRDQRDALYREAHRRFFGTFLHRPLDPLTTSQTSLTTSPSGRSASTNSTVPGAASSRRTNT
jgi:glycosyl transferase family 2